MGCPMPACAGCAQNSLLIHGKAKDPSSVVTSFFKVMIGDNFSEVLFLPPKFSRTVSDLIDQKTQLEDASGQRWTVTLSKCDGSLAFQQGWDSFSLEHGLEVGDFIVFHYIMGSHFVVQIYGKNGCPKLNFSAENGSRKKRTRTNRNSSPREGQFHSIDSDSMNKQGSSTSAVWGSNIEISQRQPMATDNTSDIDNGNGRPQLIPRTICTEEPFYMIDMDARHGLVDQRNSLYDLSNFEMQKTSGVDGTNKVLEDERSPCHGNKMPKSQAGLDIGDKIPVTEEVVSSLELSGVPDLAIHEKNEDFQMMENIASVSEKDSGNGNTFGLEQRSKTQLSYNQTLISRKEDTPLMHGSQSAQQKFAGVPDFYGLPSFFQTQNCQFEERMKVVKQEQVEMYEEVYGCGEMVNGKYPEIKECDQGSNHSIKDNDRVYKVVKTEPGDANELSSTDTVNISFLVVTDKQSFLELPTCLRSISLRQRSLRMERKVVLLRDPVSRLWPVLYLEKYGLKVMTSGWEAFGKANSIRPGDECVFGIENASKFIYRVVIVPK